MLRYEQMNCPKLSGAWTKKYHRYLSGGIFLLSGVYMSNNIYDKPFKTFEELTDVLKQKHNLKIHKKSQAAEILKVIPYYDLVNGYKEMLMINDKYDGSVTMGNLYLLHMFDHRLQNVLFEFSTYIENYFKNTLAYVISQEFGVDHNKYLDPNNYLPNRQLGKSRKKIVRQDVLNEIESIINDTRNNPTAYYKIKHNHIPPWILFKNISFSLSTNVFILLKRKQKQLVLDNMIPVNRAWNLRLSVLYYALTNIRKCRNTIAHNLKFTSFNVKHFMNNLDKETLRMLIAPELLTDKEIDEYKYLDGVYGYIVLGLSIIPATFMKLILAAGVIQALELKSGLLGGLNNRNLTTDYYQRLNIPLDIAIRLDNYQQAIVKKNCHLNVN